jgi:type VI secretion system secreted protein Hcp
MHSMKNLVRSLSGALLLAVLLLAPPAHAAVDMFLDAGAIKGESVDDTHKDQIDVLAWSWGLTNTTTLVSPGKAISQDLKITKWVDKSSPLLMDLCAQGKPIPVCILVVRKAGIRAVEYIKITMQEVHVTSVATGGSGGEDRLTENITLQFASVVFEYTPQKPDGSALTPIPFTWDILGTMK